jgi:hypothetical protein
LITDINDILNQFARAFVGTVTSDREIALPEALVRDDLDGTLESLHTVDRYLQELHTHRHELTPLTWDTTVLWCGAYVGEVIRHTREGDFTWIDYNDYVLRRPEVKQLIPQRTVTTCALLIGPNHSMSMPLNKVARFIEDGPEHSVHFFARCDLKNREQKRAHPGCL